VAFPQVSGLRFDAGDPAGVCRSLEGDRTVIANPIFAAAAGLKVGDIIPLITPKGQSYRVVAVAGDFMNAKMNTAYISQTNMAADFHKTDDIFIQLNLTPDANRAEVAAAMRDIRQDFPQFTLVEGDAYYKQMSSLFRVAFAAIFILFVFLAVPSLIAVLNTLAISVIERTRGSACCAVGARGGR
jgi:putative ABC transport system permease protein